MIALVQISYSQNKNNFDTNLMQQFDSLFAVNKRQQPLHIYSNFFSYNIHPDKKSKSSIGKIVIPGKTIPKNLCQLLGLDAGNLKAHEKFFLDPDQKIIGYLVGTYSAYVNKIDLYIYSISQHKFIFNPHCS